MLLIIPGIPSLISKNYFKAGISAAIVLVVFILYFWKAIPKNYVQLFVAMAICSFNNCIFFLPMDTLDSVSKSTVFFRAYAFGSLNVALLNRFTSLRQKLFFLVYEFAFRVGVMTYSDVSNIEFLPIARNFYIDLFVLYINFSGEKKMRSIFKSFYDYREELKKFKELLSEYFPQSILVFSNLVKKPLFLNQAFIKIFGKPIDDMDSPDLSENIQIQEDLGIIFPHTAKMDLKSLQVERDTIREVGALSSGVNFPDNLVYLYDIVTHTIKENVLDKKSLCFSASNTLNKEKKLFEVMLTKIKWDGEDATAIILSDITYQEKLLSLKIADANKDQIIATVSHELRTPLNGIIGILRMAEKSVSDEKVTQYLGLCKDNAYLLLGLVNSLLDLHQIRQGKLRLNPSRIDLKQILSEVIRLFAFQSDSQGIYLKLDISDKVCKYINTDENRLKQILINLIGNALKFTLKGGIVVEVQEDPLYSQYVEISVIDSGVGIKEEDKDKLFRMYEKIDHGRNVNKNGVGLGLTISNTLACLLSGKSGRRAIEVESSVDKGSKFSFKILKELNGEGAQDEQERVHKSFGVIDSSENSVLASQDEFQTSESPSKKLLNRQDSPSKIEIYTFPKCNSSHILTPILKKNLSKLRKYSRVSENKNTFSGLAAAGCNEEKPIKDTILVVDDNAFNLLVAESVVKDAGYCFKSASSGLEAIEIVKATRKDFNRFKLILMDCQMPIMDGFETTRILKRMMDKGEVPKIPIIALTANNGEEDIKEYYASGMLTHLSKPLFSDVLMKKLESFT